MFHSLKYHLIISALGMAWLLGGAGAQEPIPPPAPAAPPTLAVEQPSSGTLELLRELERRHGNQPTIRAEFEQHRRDEIFDEDITARGQLWFKRNPDLFRYDLGAPQPMITLVRQDAIYVYVEEFNQVQYLNFESPQEYQNQLHTLMLGFGLKPEELVRLYEIQSSEGEAAAREELVGMGLDPAAKALAILRPRPALREDSPFTLLKVIIDKGNWLPEKIWYLDPAENEMTVRMERIEMGMELDERLFTRATFPANATYINKRDVL